MPPEKMNNIAGPPVEGKDFFGRGQEVANLLNLLQYHDVLLLGPRRIGKTSLARKIMAEVRCRGWRAIEVNAAVVKDERGLLDKINATLAAEFAPVIGKMKSVASTIVGKLPKIKTVKIGAPETATVEATLGDNTTEDWTGAANDMLRRLARVEQPVLIYLDELPILLQKIVREDAPTGRQRMRRFLDWFRSEARNLPGGGKVRWLVSGSIGLDTLVQQHEMSDTLHGFRQPILEPFHEEEAVALLGALAHSYSFSLPADEAREIAMAIGWPQPYYLQVFFNELRSLRQVQADTSVGALIEQIMNRMIQPGVDNDFHHWEQRLGQQLNQAEANHALALLNRTARDPRGGRAEILLAELQGRLPQADDGETRRLFSRLRDVLVRDAYWLADDSGGELRYRFRLEPLRRWWTRRVSL